jgi:ribosome-binding factor A
MPSKIRVERISERIREELAELFIYELKDPRVSGAYVTDVTVDRELSYANIYVSALEGMERQEEIISGLNAAKDFIRRYLAKQINLRSFPNIRFYWDATPEKADQIEKLLATIRPDMPLEETEMDDEESTASDKHESTNSR